MLNSYLVIAWRNILKNKIYSFVIMLGMVVGLTSSLLISMFVQNEFTYDNQINNSELVYRIGFEVLENGVRVGTAKLAPAVAPYLLKNVPSIKDAVRFYVASGGRSRVVIGQNVFNENNLHYVDPNVFDFFPFEIIQEDGQPSLVRPASAVLTESIAKKYFPDTNPVGQKITIEADKKVDVLVTAVIKDLPGNTHLSTEIMVSIDTLKTLYNPKILDTLADVRAYTYARLKDNESFKDFTTDVTKLFKLYEGSGEVLTPLFTPVNDIHLYAAQTDNEMKLNGDINTVYVYIAIAIVMLFVAAFNFMNISTAKSVRRAKEVGIRKTLGATKNMLRLQFIIESIMLTMIALVISYALASVLLPVFGSFVDRELQISALFEPIFLVSGVVLALIVALFSGAYPAFFVSSFQPAKVLKGEATKGSSGVIIRKILVVGQFKISVVLLIITAIVYQQMEFAKSERLGYNKDQILTMKLPAQLTTQFEAFRNRLMATNGVEAVTSSSRIPTEHLGDMFPLQISGAEYAMYYNLSVGPEFFQTYDIPIIAGRGFDRHRSDEQTIFPTAENPVSHAKMIVNEAFAKRQNWTIDEAIGKHINIQLTENPREPLIKTTVIGVIGDVKFNTVREDVRPAVYVVQPDNFTRASIKVSSQNVGETLKAIESVWRDFLPFESMEAQFLDVRFAAIYHKENQLAKLFTVFVIVAVLLSCLGLLGLVAFAAERRKKEIGIRKVLGASSLNILKLFLSEFLKLVVIANVIGWPVAYLLARDWLNSFVYRIDIEVAIFVLSLIVTTAIAFATVFIQIRGVLRKRACELLSSE